MITITVVVIITKVTTIITINKNKKTNELIILVSM